MSLPRAESLTPIEVEAIVRTVLLRLRTSAAVKVTNDSVAEDNVAEDNVAEDNVAEDNVARRSASVLPKPPRFGNSVDAENATSVAAAGAVRLDQRLVALEHLRDHWKGLRVLKVPAGCVVTPAVQDELRQRGVALERCAETTGNAPPVRTAAVAKLLVLAPLNQQLGLARQLTGKEIKLQWFEEGSLGSDLADLQQHLSGGDRYALWCTPRPFAAMGQIARELKATAVQLPVLEDLPRAIEQAQPKLIVVDSSRWNTAAISQLVRNWTRSFTRS